MEKHISKKLFAGVCALSGAFILASCDPITAIPTTYNNPIVKNADDSPVNDDTNKLGRIYEAIATDRNTKIVSDLLDEVAEKKFGTFKEIQDAAADETGNAAKAYMAAHQSVFYRADDEKTDLHFGKSADEVRMNRFEIFCEDIEDRISESFWNEVTSGSYNDSEGRFDEEKLWMAHYYEFYDLNNYEAASKNRFFITNEHNKHNIMDYLTVDAYYNSEPGKRGYIEEKVFPAILKDKLVEEYVYNTNYGALGRAYARKVNYIKVSYENYLIPWNIFNSFAENYIVHKQYDNGTNPDFELITKAIKGFDSVGTFEGEDQGIVPLTGDAEVLFKSAFDTTPETINVPATIKYNSDDLIPAGNYYKETKLGKIIDSYQKACKAEDAGRFPTASDQTELDKFTASGKTKEFGLREQLISLAKEDYTTDGWFVKNGGLSELPAALRDRLFNINVANKLDNGELALEQPDEFAPEGKGTMGAYENDGTKRLPYMRNINGKKFIIPAKCQSYDEYNYNYVYHDTDAKAIYIVQVLEAPSTPKLNMDSSTSYSKLDETKGDIFKTEEIARAVAKVLGTKDSYIKDAYTEILKGYNFEFYETSLYEHFKSEYPDLFDDED